jgi:uncharacterized protein YfaT (DUF1175 family)
VVAVACAVVPAPRSQPAAHALADDSDRSAFQAWFTFLADAQFERQTPDVTDCAALVRHAYREALRAHSPDWYRRSELPLTVSFPDVRDVPPVDGGMWPLFRVARDPDRFAEFADAQTLVRFNARAVGRDAAAARPGDLLYFHQDEARTPDHLMVFVGDSRFDPSRRDWIVYHTGPDGGAPGEVRKTALADLERHPSPRWRPVAANRAFIGVFRLFRLEGRP